MAGEPLSAVALQDSHERKQDSMTNGFAAAHGPAGLPGARKSARHMARGPDLQGVAMSASEACPPVDMLPLKLSGSNQAVCSNDLSRARPLQYPSANHVLYGLLAYSLDTPPGTF